MHIWSSKRKEEEWENKNVKRNNGWKFSEFEDIQKFNWFKEDIYRHRYIERYIDIDIYKTQLEQNTSSRHMTFKFLKTYHLGGTKVRNKG